ncbi:glycosyltransferase family 2 protein [Flavobacterium sp. LB2P6]|uniref:glycosyltransferase family 2 protein n=1 Tax=unclassified Flavobacterium TaxID=196869 RepID=UPI003AAFFE46
MDKTAPFFSIVIPTYNHAHFMKRCLDSLVNQTYQNWEAIVVNNFSEDNTIEIIKEYIDPRIRLINNANGGVIAVSRNKGISEAKGDWICFLDSDDGWYPNKLEESLKYVKDYDLIYHNLDKQFPVKSNKGVVNGRTLKKNIAKDLLINGFCIPNSSVVVSKKIVDIVGKINEDKRFVAIEDSDYWMRISTITNRFKFIDLSLGSYWIGENMSISPKQIDREIHLFNQYKKLLNSTELNQALKALSIRKARIYHQLGNFKEAKNEYLISLHHPSVGVKIKSILGYVLCLLKKKT